MKVDRIHIYSWTSSFRYPRFMIGIQPTIPIPPLSTIYGLLSCVAGKQITPYDINMGYIFLYNTKFIDLESIFELESLKEAKSNIIKRENLFECHLFIYLQKNHDFTINFTQPQFPLLLGRSTELATVLEVKNIDLIKEKNKKLGKTIVPYNSSLIKGIIQSLPVYMTQDIPREAIGVQPFVILENWEPYPEEIWYDSEFDFGIWIHDIDSLGLQKNK